MCWLFCHFCILSFYFVLIHLNFLSFHGKPRRVRRVWTIWYPSKWHFLQCGSAKIGRTDFQPCCLMCWLFCHFCILFCLNHLNFLSFHGKPRRVRRVWTIWYPSKWHFLQCGSAKIGRTDFQPCCLMCWLFCHFCILFCLNHLNFLSFHGKPRRVRRVWTIWYPSKWHFIQCGSAKIGRTDFQPCCLMCWLFCHFCILFCLNHLNFLSFHGKPRRVRRVWTIWYPSKWHFLQCGSAKIGRTDFQPCCLMCWLFCHFCILFCLNHLNFLSFHGKPRRVRRVWTIWYPSKWHFLQCGSAKIGRTDFQPCCLMCWLFCHFCILFCLNHLNFLSFHGKPRRVRRVWTIWYPSKWHFLQCGSAKIGRTDFQPCCLMCWLFCHFCILFCLNHLNFLSFHGKPRRLSFVTARLNDLVSI